MTRNSKEPVREIKVAHSPDSDDAFMFYGMATNKIRVEGVRFSHTLCDIETLNRKAMEGFYDVTAISFHAYPCHVQVRVLTSRTQRRQSRRRLWAQQVGGPYR